MKIELLNEVDMTMINTIGEFDTKHIEREIVAHFLINGGYHYTYTTKEDYLIVVEVEERNYQTNEFYIKIVNFYL